MTCALEQSIVVWVRLIVKFQVFVRKSCHYKSCIKVYVKGKCLPQNRENKHNSFFLYFFLFIVKFFSFVCLWFFL